MFKVTKSHIIDPYLLSNLLPCFLDSDREFVTGYIYNGDESFTLWGNDKIIGIMGSTIISPTVLYGWSLLSVDIMKYKLSFARTMRAMIDEGIKGRGIKRFFTYINEDNKVAVRQNKWNGLIIEGLLRKNGPQGQNQYVMAKVVE
jgi:hypothetical protein